jgi:hypothetical protein
MSRNQAWDLREEEVEETKEEIKEKEQVPRPRTAKRLHPVQEGYIYIHVCYTSN